MTRVVQVWLAKFAFPVLPVVKELRKLPKLAEHSWCTYRNERFTVTRYPTNSEKERLKKWAQEWIAKSAQPKKGRRQTEHKYSVQNLKELVAFVDSSSTVKILSSCPISMCGSHNVRDPYQTTQDWKQAFMHRLF